MNDYEKLAEELESMIYRLDGLAVPDEDIDKLVYDGRELLKQAYELAAARS